MHLYDEENPRNCWHPREIWVNREATEWEKRTLNSEFNFEKMHTDTFPCDCTNYISAKQRSLSVVFFSPRWTDIAGFGIYGNKQQNNDTTRAARVSSHENLFSRLHVFFLAYQWFMKLHSPAWAHTTHHTIHYAHREHKESNKNDKLENSLTLPSAHLLTRQPNDYKYLCLRGSVHQHQISYDVAKSLRRTKLVAVDSHFGYITRTSRWQCESYAA